MIVDKVGNMFEDRRKTDKKVKEDRRKEDNKIKQELKAANKKRI